MKEIQQMWSVLLRYAGNKIQGDPSLLVELTKILDKKQSLSLNEETRVKEISDSLHQANKSLIGYYAALEKSQCLPPYLYKKQLLAVLNIKDTKDLPENIHATLKNYKQVYKNYLRNIRQPSSLRLLSQYSKEINGFIEIENNHQLNNKGLLSPTDYENLVGPFFQATTSQSKQFHQELVAYSQEYEKFWEFPVADDESPRDNNQKFIGLLNAQQKLHNIILHQWRLFLKFAPSQFKITSEIKSLLEAKQITGPDIHQLARSFKKLSKENHSLINAYQQLNQNSFSDPLSYELDLKKILNIHYSNALPKELAELVLAYSNIYQSVLNNDTKENWEQLKKNDQAIKSYVLIEKQSYLAEKDLLAPQKLSAHVKSILNKEITEADHNNIKALLDKYTQAYDSYLSLGHDSRFIDNCLAVEELKKLRSEISLTIGQVLFNGSQVQSRHLAQQGFLVLNNQSFTKGFFDLYIKNKIEFLITNTSGELSLDKQAALQAKGYNRLNENGLSQKVYPDYCREGRRTLQLLKNDGIVGKADITDPELISDQVELDFNEFSEGNKNINALVSLLMMQGGLPNLAWILGLNIFKSIEGKTLLAKPDSLLQVHYDKSQNLISFVLILRSKPFSTYDQEPLEERVSSYELKLEFSVAIEGPSAETSFKLQDNSLSINIFANNQNLNSTGSLKVASYAIGPAVDSFEYSDLFQRYRQPIIDFLLPLSDFSPEQRIGAKLSPDRQTNFELSVSEAVNNCGRVIKENKCKKHARYTEEHLFFNNLLNETYNKSKVQRTTLAATALSIIQFANKRLSVALDEQDKRRYQKLITDVGFALLHDAARVAHTNLANYKDNEIPAYVDIKIAKEVFDKLEQLPKKFERASYKEQCEKLQNIKKNLLSQFERIENSYFIKQDGSIVRNKPEQLSEEKLLVLAKADFNYYQYIFKNEIFRGKLFPASLSAKALANIKEIIARYPDQAKDIINKLIYWHPKNAEIILKDLELSKVVFSQSDAIEQIFEHYKADTRFLYILKDIVVDRIPELASVESSFDLLNKQNFLNEFLQIFRYSIDFRNFISQRLQQPKPTRINTQDERKVKRYFESIRQLTGLGFAAPGQQEIFLSVVFNYNISATANSNYRQAFSNLLAIAEQREISEQDLKQLIEARKSLYQDIIKSSSLHANDDINDFQLLEKLARLIDQRITHLKSTNLSFRSFFAQQIGLGIWVKSASELAIQLKNLRGIPAKEQLAKLNSALIVYESLSKDNLFNSTSSVSQISSDLQECLVKYKNEYFLNRDGSIKEIIQPEILIEVSKVDIQYLTDILNNKRLKETLFPLNKSKQGKTLANLTEIAAAYNANPNDDPLGLIVLADKNYALLILNDDKLREILFAKANSIASIYEKYKSDKEIIKILGQAIEKTYGFVSDSNELGKAVPQHQYQLKHWILLYKNSAEFKGFLAEKAQDETNAAFRQRNKQRFDSYLDRAQRLLDKGNKEPMDFQAGLKSAINYPATIDAELDNLFKQYTALYVELLSHNASERTWEQFNDCQRNIYLKLTSFLANSRDTGATNSAGLLILSQKDFLSEITVENKAKLIDPIINGGPQQNLELFGRDYHSRVNSKNIILIHKNKDKKEDWTSTASDKDLTNKFDEQANYAAVQLNQFSGANERINSLTSLMLSQQGTLVQIAQADISRLFSIAGQTFTAGLTNTAFQGTITELENGHKKLHYQMQYTCSRDFPLSKSKIQIDDMPAIGGSVQVEFIVDGSKFSLDSYNTTVSVIPGSKNIIDLDPSSIKSNIPVHPEICDCLRPHILQIAKLLAIPTDRINSVHDLLAYLDKQKPLDKNLKFLKEEVFEKLYSHYPRQISYTEAAGKILKLAKGKSQDPSTAGLSKIACQILVDIINSKCSVEKDISAEIDLLRTAFARGNITLRDALNLKNIKTNKLEARFVAWSLEFSTQKESLATLLSESYPKKSDNNDIAQTLLRDVLKCSTSADLVKQILADRRLIHALDGDAITKLVSAHDNLAVEVVKPNFFRWLTGRSLTGKFTAQNLTQHLLNHHNNKTLIDTVFKDRWFGRNYIDVFADNPNELVDLLNGFKQKNSPNYQYLKDTIAKNSRLCHHILFDKDEKGYNKISHKKLALLISSDYDLSQRMARAATTGKTKANPLDIVLDAYKNDSIIVDMKADANIETTIIANDSKFRDTIDSEDVIRIAQNSDLNPFAAMLCNIKPELLKEILENNTCRNKLSSLAENLPLLDQLILAGDASKLRIFLNKDVECLLRIIKRVWELYQRNPEFQTKVDKDYDLLARLFIATEQLDDVRDEIVKHPALVNKILDSALKNDELLPLIYQRESKHPKAIHSPVIQTLRKEHYVPMLLDNASDEQLATILFNEPDDSSLSKGILDSVVHCNKLLGNFTNKNVLTMLDALYIETSAIFEKIFSIQHQELRNRFCSKRFNLPISLEQEIFIKNVLKELPELYDEFIQNNPELRVVLGGRPITPPLSPLHSPPRSRSSSLDDVSKKLAKDENILPKDISNLENEGKPDKKESSVIDDFISTKPFRYK